QGCVGHQIPDGYRICGENLFAQHSIVYEDLASYFYVFSIWDEHNRCLNWADTGKMCTQLGLQIVPTLYEGVWDEALVRKLTFDLERVEGYVVRTQVGFEHADFGTHVAKWVRKGHVQTDEHWMHSAIQANRLRAPEETQ
ncbi:MAG: RNA ligase family protein, partial [bacterium]|nr:RNA ligase family protein [bacterium]